MIKYVVAIVLVAALLSGASPWPSAGFELHGPVVLDGLFGVVGAVIGVAILIAVIGWVAITILGSLLLAIIGLPMLLVAVLVVLVFAPILIPVVLLLMLVGLVIKGAAMAVAC